MDSWWELGEHSGHRGGELEVYRLRCAFCRVKGNFAVAHRETKTHADDRDKVLHFDTLRCGNCANYLMVFWSAGTGLYDYRTVPWAIGDYENIPDGWPENVGRFWQQGKRAFARGDLDAAAVMTRGRVPSRGVADRRCGRSPALAGSVRLPRETG
jgi:hypothetical protein